MEKTTRIIFAITFVASVLACGPLDESAVEDSEITETKQALSNNAIRTNITNGTVEVRVGSARYNGVLVTSRLVLTSNRWVSTATSPSSVTITWKSTAQTITRTARYIDTSAYFPGALITISPINDPTMMPINQRALSTVAASGELLRCQAYVNGTLYYSDQLMSRNPAWDRFQTTPAAANEALSSTDAGVPCFDLANNVLVGFVTGASGQVADAYSAANMAWWIQNMDYLAGLRARADNRWNHSVVGPLSLYVNAPDGSRRCMDIPWGSPNQYVGVNQYPCHSGRNQQFYLDYQYDSSRPQIVSVTSGLCLDVPGGSADGRIQQYRCHSGTNQRWDHRYWSGGGVKLLAANANNRCLGGEGVPSTGIRAVTQESCSGASDQRWYYWWR